MKKYLILTLIIFVSVASQAQRWKKNRWDVMGGIGTANFMGDLGGGAKDAAHFLGLRDLDLSSTRFNFHGALRYKLYEMVSLRLGLYTGMISANDKNSGSIGRQARNLHFRSPIVELSGQLEYYFLKEKVGSRYAISQGGIRDLVSAYMFAGMGACFFNPSAKNNAGEWVSLRALGTEGQGMYYQNDEGDLVQLPKKYSRFTMAIPLGLGVKYSLTKELALGMEVGVRYTTTDYIDDASDKYYNFNEAVANGWIKEGDFDPLAAEMADRHYMVDWFSDPENPTLMTAPGDPAWVPYKTGTAKRGSPDFNDTYTFLLVSISYKLKTSRSGLPKF